MRRGASVAVVIPALNEERSIGRVIHAIPQWVDDVVVADNGSTDSTADVARAAGARVVREPRRGYGSACLAGMAALGRPDVVVFLDADFSDHPDEMARLVDPIVANEADLVIGSRTLGEREAGALSAQQQFGNALACALIQLLWRKRFSDLGPFRAIRYSTLEALQMRDPDFGWTVEMQVKAAKRGIRVQETPVSYRRRIGQSKISGTVRGVAAAGTKILGTIFLAACNPRRFGGAPRDRLVVFARWPEPGTAKTRLIPALGPEGAARLQRAMTEHTLRWARRLRRRTGIAIEIAYAGGDEARLREWLGEDLSYAPQGPGDIGERMRRAAARALGERMERVVIVGTDCPGMNAKIVGKAFDSLRHSDVVFGPATDGGYYLVGLRRVVPGLFQGIAWSTDTVLAESLAAARRAGASAATIMPLPDVDRPEDLPVWEHARERAERRGRISVIIPTLNEAENLPHTLVAARAPGVEIIVVDGGSDDGTLDVARQHGVRVLRSLRRRATQMNLGAEHATGDVLLFLHADTLLPADYAQHVRAILKRRGVSSGAFRIRLDAPGWAYRVFEWASNLRSRRFRLPYGDQALFMRKAVFRRVGGFADLPIMEDFDLVMRLNRIGYVAIAPAAVVTSARRWQERGPWRRMLLNRKVIMAYALGVDIRKIAKWYGG